MDLRTLAGLAVVALMVGGCGGPEPASRSLPTPTPTPTPMPTPTQAPTPVAGLVEVDAGRRLFLSCAGTGAPTVIVLHGLWQQADKVHEPETFLGPLVDDLATRTRTCLYHRANVGKSDPVTEPQTIADSVADLHALVEEAELDGPFLLVGASFGGLISTLYAATHPEDVAGMVMLDASLPYDDEIDKLIPEPDRSQVVAEGDQNAERVLVSKSLPQVRDRLDDLPDVPVTYLAATQPIDVPSHWPLDKMTAAIKTYQARFVALFPRGKLVPVNSGHDIPAVVTVEHVQAMIGSSR